MKLAKSNEFSSLLLWVLKKEVKELCIELLPSYQVPNFIEIVDDIPKNGSGKKIRI